MMKQPKINGLSVQHPTSHLLGMKDKHRSNTLRSNPRMESIIALPTLFLTRNPNPGYSKLYPSCIYRHTHTQALSPSFPPSETLFSILLSSEKGAGFAAIRIHFMNRTTIFVKRSHPELITRVWSIRAVEKMGCNAVFEIKGGDEEEEMRGGQGRGGEGCDTRIERAPTSPMNSVSPTLTHFL